MYCVSLISGLSSHPAKPSFTTSSQHFPKFDREKNAARLFGIEEIAKINELIRLEAMHRRDRVGAHKFRFWVCVPGSPNQQRVNSFAEFCPKPMTTILGVLGAPIPSPKPPGPAPRCPLILQEY